jgi:uncharacterized RDD family membrane protein YckC
MSSSQFQAPDTAPEADVGSQASFGARFSARVFDTAIALLLLVLGFAGATKQSGTPVLIAFLLCLIYILFADALPNGQSLGKRLLGIAVVDERTSRPCTLVQSLIRNGLLLCLGIIDWLCIFTRMRQRIGDRAARTVVVKL